MGSVRLWSAMVVVWQVEEDTAAMCEAYQEVAGELGQLLDFARMVGGMRAREGVYREEHRGSDV